MTPVRLRKVINLPCAMKAARSVTRRLVEHRRFVGRGHQRRHVGSSVLRAVCAPGRATWPGDGGWRQRGGVMLVRWHRGSGIACRRCTGRVDPRCCRTCHSSGGRSALDAEATVLAKAAQALVLDIAIVIFDPVLPAVLIVGIDQPCKPLRVRLRPVDGDARAQHRVGAAWEAAGRLGLSRSRLALPPPPAIQGMVMTRGCRGWGGGRAGGLGSGRGGQRRGGSLRAGRRCRPRVLAMPTGAGGPRRAPAAAATRVRRACIVQQGGLEAAGARQWRHGSDEAEGAQEARLDVGAARRLRLPVAPKLPPHAAGRRGPASARRIVGVLRSRPLRAWPAV
jgi:hypothetical protein